MDEIHREIETEIREMNGITWGANFGINFVGQCIACSDAEGVDRERDTRHRWQPFHCLDKHRAGEGASFAPFVVGDPNNNNPHCGPFKPEGAAR